MVNRFRFLKFVYRGLSSCALQYYHLNIRTFVTPGAGEHYKHLIQ